MIIIAEMQEKTKNGSLKQALDLLQTKQKESR